MYYGTSVGAKLYMGASTAAVLPAPGSDSFTEVPLLGMVTPPANTISVSFFNVQNDSNKRSVGGKSGDRTLPGNIVIDWTEAIHASMYADSVVAGGQKRNWRLVYPDANARQLDFVAFLSSWTESPLDSAEDAKEHRADFVLNIDGAITVTP